MKILRNAFLLLCSVIMAAAVVSCEEETQEITIRSYSLNGEISVHSTDLTLPQPTPMDYTSAINDLLGGVNYTEEDRDADVIAACDKVYSEHMAYLKVQEGVMTAKGTVSIVRIDGTSSDPDEELPSTTLVTYTYE